MLAEVRRRALASLVPPARLPLSAWIEANVRLPEGTTAVPGPMRLWPYQRGIADSIGDPTVERVILIKPERVDSAIGYHVANEPAPIRACCRPRRIAGITWCRVLSRPSLYRAATRGALSGDVEAPRQGTVFVAGDRGHAAP